MGKKRRRKPIPLVKSGATAGNATSTAAVGAPMKSRKRARQVTTLFHKLTRERDMAAAEGDAQRIEECNLQLQNMGGRPEYQRASQLSTSHFSTSKKWVLGYLAKNGWIYGIKEMNNVFMGNGDKTQSKSASTAKEQRKMPRRTTRILEVGAINTDLLDAAVSARTDKSDGKPPQRNNNIHVRSIDLHAMDPRIEEFDFLKLPYVDDNPHHRYDVVVCSMVLNCVTTASDRGKMLFLLLHHLRPGGLCFLTIPKFCVTKSAFLTPALFEKMLGETGVGFEMVETKFSPRIAFFILRRPVSLERQMPVNTSWTKQLIRNKGKKFPNQFSVILNKEHMVDETLHDNQNEQLDKNYSDGGNDSYDE